MAAKQIAFDQEAREAMRRAIHKLPMKARFITRETGEL